MPDVRVVCAGCGTAEVFDGVVSRSACCRQCGADLRCCNNCRFYDASAYNECAEPSAERVVEKDRANFCDYFSPPLAASLSGARGAAGSRASGGTADPDRAAPDSLEDLFRKR